MREKISEVKLVSITGGGSNITALGSDGKLYQSTDQRNLFFEEHQNYLMKEKKKMATKKVKRKKKLDITSPDITSDNVHTLDEFKFLGGSKQYKPTMRKLVTFLETNLGLLKTEMEILVSKNDYLKIELQSEKDLTKALSHQLDIYKAEVRNK